MDAFVRRLPKKQSSSREHSPTTPSLAEIERPLKRLKKEEISDSESNDSEFVLKGLEARKPWSGETATDNASRRQSGGWFTDVENVLPPTQTSNQAIEEYETLRTSQLEAKNAGASEKTRPMWIKGRSSIYVDAFNLALDAVLDEESNLFDEKEVEVFKHWRELNYEAQYLYVRLFLRKTAAWHRSSRLGYYDDVADPELAIETLQSVRQLPQTALTNTPKPIPGMECDDFEHGSTFTFADISDEHIKTVEEAASLLFLDELKAVAKEAKVQGRNKMELIKGLSRMSQQQTGLTALGISRQNSRNSSTSDVVDAVVVKPKVKLRREDSCQEQHFLAKILTISGPCIRLSPLTFKLFERVHLVFYRSTEWTEKSLTTIILAKIARRNFPEYIVCRTSTIFASRMHLLEFENAIRLEANVDNQLESSGSLNQDSLQKVVDVFDMVYPRWKELVEEEADKERRVYEMGEGAYLRRFNPAHSYTRIIHKATSVFGKLKSHAKEHTLLTELLDQKLFHLARRGAWYQRKALMEEHYMPILDENPVSQDLEQQKKHWRAIAVATCETGLQDPDCHLIFHYDLQKRIIKLEKKLRIPRRLQHDFGHVRLAEPLEISVEGIQLKRDEPPKPGGQASSTKTIWLDELDSDGECSVEEMCLNHFRTLGWKGYHAEGGIVRTMFAYLFYDILFLYIPNVFQTAFQTCPLDLHTDAFYSARASEINHRLVEITNGEAERLLRGVWDREHERRTSVVGLNWDFDVNDLTELVRCFDGSALAAVCKVMAQEYRYRGGGIPDLILWRANNESEQVEATKSGEQQPGNARGEVMFAEVKSANDRLSDTQRLWIHVLTGAGIKVALCHAVAKEVREVAVTKG